MPAEHERLALLRLLDRPRVPLLTEWALLGSPALGLSCSRFTFAAEAGERVPGLLIKDDSWSEPRPVVMVAHGTGGSKQAVLQLLLDLCGRGFIAVAIDGRHHGERAERPDAGAATYLAAIADKFRGGPGYPFLYDTVWDLMRVVDCLLERPDVDASRIGLLGVSKGGMETYLAAAADPRFAVAVPVLGVQSFGYALEQAAWQPRIQTIQSAFDAAARQAGVEQPDAAFVRHFYDRVVPGIYSHFDAPLVLQWIAPRPLLVINGELDARTPGLELCREGAAAAYTRAGLPEALQFHVQRGVGHEFAPAANELAFSWLCRWLQPAREQ